MKPTSPLSLLLFLQLTSAAPLHYYHSKSTPQCPFASCKEFLENGHTPATTISKLTDPHFPTHQLSASEEPLDNRPYTPSSRVSPSEALAATRPLSSAYLRSLSNPASFVQIQKSPIEKSLDALPSKPTSALPVLRKEDAKRYWASTALKGEIGDEVVMEEGPVMAVRPHCGSAEMKSLGGGFFVRVKAARTGFVVREYSDVMVVGIVLLFLVIVVFIEAMERFGSIGAMFTRNRRRHGQIYLEDDETVAYIVKKPFQLQPAPSSRYKIRTDSEKSALEKDGFQYDSDAGEMV